MEANLPPSLFYTLPAHLQTDWELLTQAHTQAATFSIRLNPNKESRMADSLPKVPWCTQGYYYDERPIYTADPLLHAGAYYVQEASSMFLEYALKQFVDFSELIFALDLCAAPGGKSTLIASLLNDESLLISNEIIPNRASILLENIIKWGQANTVVCNNEPSHFSEKRAAFNLLAIDAPCSGSGLFRKMPSFKNEWNLDLVKLSAERQKRIIEDSYPCLAQHGILVYMTCSYCREENEDIVDFILETFDAEPLKLSIPAEWGIVETKSEYGGYGYRFFPHLLRGEGFFLSVFKKQDGESFISPSNSENTPSPKWLEPFIRHDQKLIVQSFKDEFIGITPSAYSFIKRHGKDLKFYKRGLKLGKVIREELIPDHELALYHHNIFENKIEISLNEAIKYLRKEHINVNTDRMGWQLISYLGHPLGWIKNLGNRVNNYYPNQYRIVSKNILPPLEN